MASYNKRIVMTKKCSRCQKIKELNDFWAATSKAAKKQSWCKECMQEYKLNWKRNRKLDKNILQSNLVALWNKLL